MKSVFWALERLRGSFSGIRAHREFELPDLFMPQLLIKEQWVLTTITLCNTNSYYLLSLLITYEQSGRVYVHLEAE